ncbi:MAG: hypothetical protein IKB81_06300 [Paludibacteraceae bacterium]|nr:hypothetical protein [Paludibacteraceae bacterium]
MEIQHDNNDDARIARREAILRAFTPTIQLSPLEGGVVQEIIVEEGAPPCCNASF